MEGRDATGRGQAPLRGTAKVAAVLPSRSTPTRPARRAAVGSRAAAFPSVPFPSGPLVPSKSHAGRGQPAATGERANYIIPRRPKFPVQCRRPPVSVRFGNVIVGVPLRRGPSPPGGGGGRGPGRGPGGASIRCSCMRHDDNNSTAPSHFGVRASAARRCHLPALFFWPA